MKKHLLAFFILITIGVVAFCFLMNGQFFFHKKSFATNSNNEENEMSFVEERVKYEFDMLKDPVTGKIPYHIYEQELAFAKNLPVKNYGSTSRGQDMNNYFPAGPNNIGGRTRALAYDVRYNGSTNKVILAGSVSGGIMRTTDGGQTWTRVSPNNEIHNVTTIAQDPRSGFQDTWYAGGGEPYGNSASEIGATYLGYGLYKSTDNGASWIKLPLNTVTDINGMLIPPGTLEAFDHPFDFVHKIAVNPVNGNVYIACHRRLIRTIDGGNNFLTVFGSTVAATASAGQMDVAITSSGKIVLVVNGGNPDTTLRGVWTSTTGNQSSFTRIAGGPTLGVDSASNWRGNSYSFFSGTSTYIPKRIVLSLAPSNQNIAYIMYENGLSNASPNFNPEADLFKLDMTSGNSWANQSANMPNFSGGNNTATNPFAIQGGYDMIVTVKPTDPNFVIIGGTSLYRSTDGLATPAAPAGNLTWIGGYSPTSITSGLSIYPNSHPDIHNFAFNPSNPNEGLCANDGGVQITSDINVAGNGNVVWSMISNYQTLQYYYVAIDPENGANDFVGGAQDNGTQFRDKTGLLGTAASDSNNHRRILGGDGCAVGFSKITGGNQYVYEASQLGNIRRFIANPSMISFDIRPNSLTPNSGTTSEYGEFVTNFRLDPDNTEDLYYANFSRLFRTTNASSVTPSSWTELTGVGTTVDPGGINATNHVRALAFSRGPYATSHVLYVGTTKGKIFRIDDPRNVLTTNFPIEITPPGNTGNVQDIAVNPNNDDEILAVISNYNTISIWWTNNAKSANPIWKNAEGNLTLPSIRSCAIVVKKDAANNPVTEYYVGTSVGLYSAVNIGPTLIAGGSPTWQREGGNVLNLAVIQSLAYRPVDNVLVVGTHGNGMYYAFLGTPNFVPNQNTGFNDPILNNKNFIKQVFPTYSQDQVNYRIGNLFTIKQISIQLFNLSGQEILKKQTNYQDGKIDISRIAGGAYILSITSDDGKYRHLQKIIKQ
jgi:hypothetical protein